MPRVRLAVLLLGPILLLGIGVWGQAPAVPSSSPLYAEHPPLGHTGGFGEPTCHACHFGGEVNGGGGALTVEGLPDSVRPGRSYALAVTLTAEMKRSGFMLSVREPDGSQTGRLTPLDTAGVAVGSPDTSTVQYAHHTLDGTVLSGPNRATWSVRWEAPDAAGDTVLVHVAANAANDDASEFGDDVYAAAARAVVAE